MKILIIYWILSGIICLMKLTERVDSIIYVSERNKYILDILLIIISFFVRLVYSSVIYNKNIKKWMKKKEV